jgi:hypothetical protein
MGERCRSSMRAVYNNNLCRRLGCVFRRCRVTRPRIAASAAVIFCLCDVYVCVLILLLLLLLLPLYNIHT